MRADRRPNAADSLPSISAGALLILLLLILFAGRTRRQAAGGIRVATPAFVPLAQDAASQVASELGAAVGELLDAERRRSEG
ncbi:MAG: hypothetical protein WEB29_03140 [Chloroflexota bacterium]